MRSLFVLASVTCGKREIPDVGQIVAAGEIACILPADERSRLSLATLNALDPVVVIPENNQTEISGITQLVRMKIRQKARVGATVTSLLFHLAYCSLERVLVVFEVAAGNDPEAGVVDSWNVVAMLQKRGTVFA
jgi:hypothetical protein